MSQTETESEFSEMDSMVYSSSTSVMSQIAYHQRCQDQLQPQHQSLSMEEQSDIERGSSARKEITVINSSKWLCYSNILLFFSLVNILYFF